ncbi:MAG TPA: YhfX family PLP-dependent enzyme [Selenomonadales bacterium]|nr:YhfX family PLP-dependent enzyme [Selenomonadales bacterium]
MFLATLRRRNPALLETALAFHRRGIIRPDTYVLDLDAICHNGRLIKQQADAFDIELYFMTKQLGRNPLVARALMDVGYQAAVAVDYKEADRLWGSGIPLGNVGHLVQIPSAQVAAMVRRRPRVITVYSVEKAGEISAAAVQADLVQNLMLRVIGEGDVLYPGQYGGFALAELAAKAQAIAALPNLRITGLTSFPCFLFDEEAGRLAATHNVRTLGLAKKILAGAGIAVTEVNMPSATCVATIPDIARHGGTHGEPGHGLLGTTPLHAATDQPEAPAVVYVSEISHQLEGRSYCYGGGYYRRSHMVFAAVGNTPDALRQVDVESPDTESIDYYLRLNCRADVGETVLMAFRTQIFVTRSDVAVVEGIQAGTPRLAGIYDSQGYLLGREGYR